MKRLLLFPLLILCSPALQAQKSDPAAHPYMGWSSWSLMRKEPTEDKIKAQADALLKAHLDTYGYRYINVDDYWNDGFDANGYPTASPKLFPSGMKSLADSMHQRGLKFGLYLNPGIAKNLYAANPLITGTTVHFQDIADTHQEGNTRGGSYHIDFNKPGAAEYLNGFAKLLAKWGVDYIKMDFVGPGGGRVKSDNLEEIRQWRLALARAGRPIWLELSNKMSLEHAAEWRENANGWRIEGDIECYSCKEGLTRWSNVAQRFKDLPPWTGFAGPGGWNDLDTMELGNGDRDGLTEAERQSMFTLWAMACAPLYLGTDLTKMDPGDLALLTHFEVIAVDQAGIPARLVEQANPDQQVWVTKSADGSLVVALFNLGSEKASISLNAGALGLPAKAAFRDLWKAKTIPAARSFELESHASLMLRITATR